MTGKASRAKGARWERELVKRFQAVMQGAAIRRTGWLQVDKRDGVESSMFPDVYTDGIFWVEAKCGKRPSIPAALRQAIRDRKSAGQDATAWAVCCIKDLREREFAVMPFKDFADFDTELRHRTKLGMIFVSSKGDGRRALALAQAKPLDHYSGGYHKPIAACGAFDFENDCAVAIDLQQFFTAVEAWWKGR